MVEIVSKVIGAQAERGCVRGLSGKRFISLADSLVWCPGLRDEEIASAGREGGMWRANNLGAKSLAGVDQSWALIFECEA